MNIDLQFKQNRLQNGLNQTLTSGSNPQLIMHQVHHFIPSLFLIIGNSMAFAGVPSGKDRADLIAFLKSK